MRLILALVVAVAIAGCGGNDDESAGTTEAATTTSFADGCKSVEAPDAKPDGGQKAPMKDLNTQTRFELVVSTNCGSFTIKLDQGVAPKTVASLVSLADAGFFDGTIFHRVVPGFVIQGGDPTGTGTGGPGYSTGDRPPVSAKYVKGVVAMAKGPLEPAGTSGSQFFVVTGADIGLPAEYAIVGFVTEGMDTVMRIDALGVGDGPPSEPVVVDKVTVREG